MFRYIHASSFFFVEGWCVFCLISMPPCPLWLPVFYTCFLCQLQQLITPYHILLSLAVAFFPSNFLLNSSKAFEPVELVQRTPISVSQCYLWNADSPVSYSLLHLRLLLYSFQHHCSYASLHNHFFSNWTSCVQNCLHGTHNFPKLLKFQRIP